MHVDFGIMGRELGIRPDGIRIALGIPTKLQRLVRSAIVFEDIAALNNEFVEGDRYRNCGPKFEQAEKEEYLARRTELFPAYLARFETIESFKEFGMSPGGFRITSNEEASEASEKFCGLFKSEIEKAKKLSEGKLERLMEIRASISLFVQQIEDGREHGGISVYRALQNAMDSIRDAFRDELRVANDKGVTQMILVFKKLGNGLSRSDLGDRHSVNHELPWSILWRSAATMEEIFLIEKEVPNSFLDEKEIENCLANLSENAIEGEKSFEAAFAKAKLLSGRDGYRASRAYSRALTVAAGKIRFKSQLRQFIAVWETRKEGRSISGDEKYPTLPDSVLKKWNYFFLKRAESEQNLSKLAQLMDESPWSSKTKQVASKRLQDHFARELAQAQTEKEAERVSKDAKALSIYILVPAYQRKMDIRGEHNAERIRSLWETIERGDTVDDEKKVLIGLFHEFKASDPEKARNVLIRLARHFPAETVDEIPTEAL